MLYVNMLWTIRKKNLHLNASAQIPSHYEILQGWVMSLGGLQVINLQTKLSTVTKTTQCELYFPSKKKRKWHIFWHTGCGCTDSRERMNPRGCLDMLQQLDKTSSFLDCFMYTSYIYTFIYLYMCVRVCMRAYIYIYIFLHIFSLTLNRFSSIIYIANSFY